MIVRELIELLQKQNENDLVIMSKDEEGNSFSKVIDISESVYRDGDIYIRELTEDLEASGYCEEDVCHGDGCINCIVLWP